MTTIPRCPLCGALADYGRRCSFVIQHEPDCPNDERAQLRGAFVDAARRVFANANPTNPHQRPT